MHTFDFIVIGKGLMGSAAFRHLSEQTRNVAVIGPDEPQQHATHDGVFASHYDEGRLTGRLTKDIVWAHLSAWSIARYRALEARSGIPFYTPCGRLTVVREEQPRRYLTQRDPIAQALNVEYDTFRDAAQIAQRFPMFGFPAGFSGVFERPPAGYILPRALIRAQLAIAEQNGATLVREEVRSVQVSVQDVEVTTQSGQRLHAKQVLVASGAFSNCYDLLPRKLALRVKTETTVLAEVGEAEVARLQAMPTVGYEIDSTAIDGIYMAPPLRYPDGRSYIKLGCDTTTDEALRDLAAMQRWMQAGRDDGMGEIIYNALRSFMPGLDSPRYQVRPCVVTYTPHSKPFVDQLSDRLFVATGGNGSSAACSETLGFLAASLMLGQAWPTQFERATFRAIYADEPIGEIASLHYGRL